MRGRGRYSADSELITVEGAPQMTTRSISTHEVTNPTTAEGPSCNLNRALKSKPVACWKRLHGSNCAIFGSALMAPSTINGLSLV